MARGAYKCLLAFGLALSVTVATYPALADVDYNNGLAPPNPANTVTDLAISGETVHVLDEFCASAGGCTQLGSPTTQAFTGAGGSIPSITAWYTSTAVIESATVGDLLGWLNGTLDVRGGNVTQALVVDDAALVMSGGIVGQVWLDGPFPPANVGATVSGGSLTLLGAESFSRALIDGGQVGAYDGRDDAHLELRSGEITAVSLIDRAHMEMAGGIAREITLDFGTSLVVTGGTEINRLTALGATAQVGPASLWIQEVKADFLSNVSIDGVDFVDATTVTQDGTVTLANTFSLSTLVEFGGTALFDGGAAETLTCLQGTVESTGVHWTDEVDLHECAFSLVGGFFEGDLQLFGDGISVLDSVYFTNSGSGGSLAFSGTSQVTIRSITMDGPWSIYAFGDAHVVLAAGEVTEGIGLGENAQLEIQGGLISNVVQLSDTATLDQYAGEVQISNPWDASIIRLHGTDFTFDDLSGGGPVPVSYGVLDAPFGEVRGDGTLGPIVHFFDRTDPQATGTILLVNPNPIAVPGVTPLALMAVLGLSGVVAGNVRPGPNRVEANRDEAGHAYLQRRVLARAK